MRKSLLAGGLAAASLVLAACGGGGSPSASNNGGGHPASLTSLFSTVGTSSDVQLHITGSGTGFTSTHDEQLAKQFSIDVAVSNPAGGTAGATGAKDNVEFIVNVGTSAFLDVRSVSPNVYLKLDLTALSSLPGIPAAELQQMQLFLGGKWFEIPSSLLKANLPKTTVADEARAAADRSKAAQLLSALETALEANHHAIAGGGFGGSGTIKSIATAILPAVRAFDRTAASANTARGTYAYTVKESGSTMTGLTLSVTAPNTSTGANATLSLAVTIAHANQAVTAPSGATLLTKSLLRGLLGSIVPTHHAIASGASSLTR